ncbi:MAG: arginine deiminase [Spirochaetae bacterium HGW-Spirochaetae-2]|jgi:arginine deiminase|nr:MAG: arginine deiminase [Spirochaetae bacterium HGW-Spirochaetae-2]
METRTHITSEVGKLNDVLLHRPGRELESLTPQYLDFMLFEDIPYLAQMQYEHDQFARLLEAQGCRVHYVEALLEEILGSSLLRDTAVAHIVESSKLFSQPLKHVITEYLLESSPKQLAAYCVGGLLKSEVDSKVQHKTLSYFIRDTYPYYISPLPNLYFTRDPATVVGNGVSINVMKTEARRRENWLISLLADNHPLFASSRTHRDYSMGSSIEGGDILVLSDSCALVGSSARTDVWAIEAFARRMMAPLECGGEGLREILVVQIPYTRAYMHLDTVFTMVDRDKFCIYGGIKSSLRVFSMVMGHGDSLEISEERGLKQALKRVLGLPALELIQSGGKDPIASAREQWNDSTNTLAVAPGTVITYRRNVVSNETLERHGITVLPISGSELVRGRGGPRCMSMPLNRDDL